MEDIYVGFYNTASTFHSYQYFDQPLSLVLFIKIVLLPISYGRDCGCGYVSLNAHYTLI